MLRINEPMATISRPLRRPSRLVSTAASKSGSVEGVQQKMTSALRSWLVSSRRYSTYDDVSTPNFVSAQPSRSLRYCGVL